MDQHPDHRFGQYFKGLIQKYSKTLKIQLNDSDFIRIPKIYMDGKDQKQIHTFVASLTSEPIAKKQINELMLKESKILIEISTQYCKIIHEEENEHFSQQVLTKEKLLIFLYSQLIQESKFERILQRDMELSLSRQELAQILLEFKHPINIANNEEFKNKIHSKLLKQNDYSSYSVYQQTQILNLFLKRKDAFEGVTSILKDHDIKEFDDFLSFLERPNDHGGKEQDPQQFLIKAQNVLTQAFNKFKKFRPDSQSKIIDELYQQSFEPNRVKIQQILLTNKLVPTAADIKPEFFKEIYPSASEFLLKQISLGRSQNSWKNAEPNSFEPSAKRHPHQVNFHQPNRESLYENQQRQKQSIQFKKASNTAQNSYSKPQQQDIIFEKEPTEGNSSSAQSIPNQKQKCSKNIFMSSNSFIIEEESHQGEQLKFQKGEKEESIKISMINNEIESIKKEIQEIICFQTCLRNLEIQIRKNNIEKIISYCQRVEQLLQKYQLQSDSKEELKDILNPHLTKVAKLPKIISLRRKTQVINLEQILSTKKYIQTNKQCEGASAIILIGQTGAGKSTTFVGLAGHALQFNPETKDYLPRNLCVREEFKISSSSESVTRWANVTKIPARWIGKKTIFLIDTPGLGDNRGVEIDITNNMGTVKLLKTLGKGRIVIVLSRNNFRDRWYSDFVRIIRGLSKYLTSFDDIKNSVTFILTKGLTKILLYKQFVQFKGTESFLKENWNQNEDRLIRLIESKISKLPLSNEIKDPCNHNFQELADELCKIVEDQEIGKYISTSYSQDSEKHILNTFSYLSHMTKKTFKRRQYALTKFYICRLKTLEEIYCQKPEFEKCKQSLISELTSKIREIQSHLNDYLETGRDASLNQLKTYYYQMIDKGLEVLYEILYPQNQKQVGPIHIIPRQMAIRIINEATQKLETLLEKIHNKFTEKVEFYQIQLPPLSKSQRRQIVYGLNLIKIFKSEQEYNKLVRLNQTQNKFVKTQFEKFLIKQFITQNEWKQAVNIFEYQLNFNQEVEEIPNQRISEIANCVESYLKHKCQEKIDIQLLISQSLQIQLNGQFIKKCEQFFKKLSIIKETHHLLSDVAEKQTKSLVGLLELTIVEFQKKQQLCFNLNQGSSLLMFEIYQQNKKIMYQILLRLKSSQIHYFSFQKKQQSMYSNIERNIKQDIKTFTNDISALIMGNSTQNFVQIIENLQKIFTILNFIQSSRKPKAAEQKNCKIKEIERRVLQQSLKKSELQLQKIEQKILDIVRRKKVINYEINNRLIISYLVLREFSLFTYSNQNETKIKKRVQIMVEIRRKILAPFDSIKNSQFKVNETNNDYQRLYNVLKYFRLLDNKLSEMGVNVKQFEELIPLDQSQELKKLLIKCYTEMKEQYQSLKNIVDLMKLKFITKKENKDEKQQFMNGIPLAILNLAAQQKIYHVQGIENQSKPKPGYADQLFSDKNILKKLINYLIKYDSLEVIQNQFKEEIDLVQQYTNNINQISIKKEIVNRISNISSEMNRVQNLTERKPLDLQDLCCTFKQLEFISMILKQFKNQIQLDIIENHKLQIKNTIQSQYSSFQECLKRAQFTYKQALLNNNVDFDDLKKLMNHKFSINNNNKDDISILLMKIQNHYASNIRTIYYPILFNNTDVLLNMAEFQKIVKDKSNKFPIVISYMNQTYEKKCHKYFNDLFIKVTELTQKLMKGKCRNEKQINAIYIEQAKIQSFLPKEYVKFKTKYLAESNDENLKKKDPNTWTLQEYITEKSNQIGLKLMREYFNQSIQLAYVTQEYNQIFYNTSNQNRQIMKNIYIETCRKKFKQIERYLDQDHDKLNLEIRNIKFEFDGKIPEPIKTKSIKDQLAKIQTAKQNIFSEWSLKIKTANSQNNLKGILEGFDYADRKKNTSLKKQSQESLQIYYSTQKNNLQPFDIVKITKNLSLYMGVKNTDLFKTVQGKADFLKNLHQGYIEKLQQTISENNLIIIKTIKSCKQRLIDANKIQTFALFKFNENIQNSGANEFIERLKLLKLFKQIFENITQVLLSQFEQLKQNLIKEANQLIDKFKNIILVPSKAGEPLKYNKIIFVELIRQVKIIAACLTKFNNIIKGENLELITVCSTITQLNSLIDEFKQIIHKKQTEIQYFDIEECLSNDTDERMAERFIKLEENFMICQDLKHIMKQNQLPHNQMMMQIQPKFNNIIDDMHSKFQKAALEDLHRCFLSPPNSNGGTARKYYDFQKMISKKKFKIFYRVTSQNKVKKQLINNFEKVVEKIDSFLINKNKKQQFDVLLFEDTSLAKSQNDQISKINRQIQENYEKQKTQAKAQKLKKISGLVELNQQQIKAQTAQIQKQFETNLRMKEKDNEDRMQSEKQAIQRIKNSQKFVVFNKITDLINDDLLKYIVTFYHIIRYFDCEEKISAYPRPLNDLLKKIEKTYSKKFTNYLYKCLAQNGSDDCLGILDNPVFKSYQANIFAQETKGQTIQKLVESMKQFSHHPDKKQKLINKYKSFSKQYEAILDDHKTSNSFINSQQNIINTTKIQGKKLGLAYDSNNQASENMVKLLAHIFSLWTICEADNDDNNQVVYIYKPHAGQVLAIFLLLGLQSKNPPKDIQKRMIQVSTGEGKSVVLGVLSAYLALIGYHVFEACFSQYLSQRDFETFKKLFQKLQIASKITYNLFHQICRSVLDGSSNETFTGKIQQLIENSKKNIAGKVVDKILNLFSSNSSNPSQNWTRKNIFLIDQADVFFDEKYLGQLYTPSIQYRTENVEKLLYYVWTFRQNAATLDPAVIINSSQFKAVIDEYKNKTFEEIMKNQVHAMIKGLQNFKADHYTIIGGKIYYKEGDGLTDKVRHGYKTIFSYFYRNEVTKQINKADVIPHIAIYFIAATFSYSLLPKYFNSILGVTGTLDSMSSSRKQILKQNFQLEWFVQPSIYPASGRNVQFKKCSNSKLYQEIVSSIDEQIQKKRPVLVFFKTKSEVYNFADSQQFKKYRSNSSIVTYEIAAKDRDFRIKTATDEGKITLLTQDFSRGTDFKMKAKNKDEHPGLHVIGAYLPEAYSDYIQLIGRTGRQGRKGTALVLIVESENQSQNLANNTVVISQSDGQLEIKQLEEDSWKKKKQELQIKMQTAKHYHQDSLQIYKKSRPSVDEILENLKRLNKEPQISFIKSRTVICIDGTGSMGSVFDKLKQVIREAIPDIYETLKDTKTRAEFYLKFVVYRNYNVHHTQLLEHSNFFDKFQPLVDWLRGISVNGGLGNEAIEVCLQYVNSLEKVNQMIIIADAESNTKSQTQKKRGSADNYWTDNNFKITNFEDQFKELKQKKVKCHSYYIGKRIKPFFDRMSKQTGGVSQEFFVKEASATQKFKDFVALQILSNVGDLGGGDLGKTLVNAYFNVSNRKTYI